MYLQTGAIFDGVEEIHDHLVVYFQVRAFDCILCARVWRVFDVIKYVTIYMILIDYKRKQGLRSTYTHALGMIPLS